MPEPTTEAQRGIWSRYFSPFEREEEGLPPIDVRAARTDESSLIPAQDKLLMFRSIVGIGTVSHLHGHRIAPNLGIYTRVVRAERVAKRGYRFYSFLINLFLGVQIVVAAILTALGAADGPHTAVTAFGAINTIVAGAMTYLKGSGLPNRLRHHENEWKVIREYIEQREREFCMAGCPLVVDEELLIVEEMYKKTKTELEAGSSQGSYKSGSNAVSKPPLNQNAPSAPPHPPPQEKPPSHPPQSSATEPKKPEPALTPPPSENHEKH